MNKSQFLNKAWTSIWLNRQMIVLKIEGGNDRLFLGSVPTVGQKMADLFPNDGEGRLLYLQIAEGVVRAEEENRTVYLEYTPTNAGEALPAVAFAEYCGEGIVCLHMTAISDSDLRRVREEESENLRRRNKIINITMEAMKAYTWFYEPEIDRVSFWEGFDVIRKGSLRYDTLGKFLDFVHPEDRQLFENSIRGVLRNESEEWNVEYRAELNEDGQYQWWQTRGVIERTLRNDVPYTYMFGMTINIDEHKQAELVLLNNKEELKQLIRQNEMILNNTNSGLAYITADYVVQWENISICLNAPFEAYRKGKICYESAHGRTSPCEDCAMKRTFQSHQMGKITRMIGDRMVEIFAIPVFNEEGAGEGIVIRVDDVTERERMIEDLKYAVQSDKLKSAFLANMSHEIRTPLNAIVGFSELLMNETDETEKSEFIRIINNNNELLLKLINDILDLSKIESGAVELKYEEFDFSVYFEEVAVSMKQRIMTPKVQMIVTNPYPSCMVRQDKNRIAQVLINYMTNAIKYTKEGSIEMGYELLADKLRIYVKDTGIGIQEDKKDKVFMRFEKLDEFAQGTGLGLSICKAVAEAMGGEVGFESKYGDGSFFWAIFPCSCKG